MLVRRHGECAARRTRLKSQFAMGVAVTATCHAVDAECWPKDDPRRLSIRFSDKKASMRCCFLLDLTCGRSFLRCQDRDRRHARTCAGGRNQPFLPGVWEKVGSSRSLRVLGMWQVFEYVAIVTVRVQPMFFFVSLVDIYSDAVGIM